MNAGQWGRGKIIRWWCPPVDRETERMNEWRMVTKREFCWFARCRCDQNPPPPSHLPTSYIHVGNVMSGLRSRVPLPQTWCCPTAHPVPILTLEVPTLFHSRTMAPAVILLPSFKPLFAQVPPRHFYSVVQLTHTGISGHSPQCGYLPTRTPHSTHPSWRCR